MVSAAEQLAANLNFGALAKAEELKKRIWFTLGALLVYRLGTYIPLPGIDPNAWDRDFPHPGRRHPRHVQHVRRWRHPPHGDLRAQHHAVHFRLDHHSADDDGVADARAAQEGGRGRAQDDQPVHAVSHRGAGGVSGLRHRRRAGRSQQRGHRSGPVLPHLHRDHAHRRHHVPDVARRADHAARHRQRHFADHHVGHRRAVAARRSPARSNSAARARSRPGSFSSSW